MIFTNSDGGARGNPGPGAIGIIVREDDKILIKYSQKIGNYVTNNIAEYEALIKALELASQFTKDEVTCILDSELVVNQLLGKYKVRHQNIISLFLKVQKLQENFNKIIYKHVSREDKYQIIVDEMLNDTLDKELGVKRSRYRKVYS
ncbi:MAG: ribonuclease HI family protein [Nanoarchaeota archaeon]